MASLSHFHLLPTQADRFQAHSQLGNRKLLWHGTNVAVVAAILTSGLRIMPHSGGRVGKGIYFASENSKSAGYGEAPWGRALGGWETEENGAQYLPNSRGLLERNP